MNLKIIESTPIGLSDVKGELAKIKKRYPEASSRFLRVEEYINSFVNLSRSDYDSLLKELHALDIPRLKDSHIIKIADLIPSSVGELKVILQGYALTVSVDNMKKIVSITSKFVPESK